jgi:hypothetical protein
VLFEVTTHYSEAMIRSAARRFLLRYARRDVTIATVAILMALGLWLILDFDWRMPTGLLAISLALLLTVLVTEFRYTQQSLAKFKAMNDTTASWRFTQEFIAAKTELGSSEFRWQVVSQIWRYSDMWLLLYGRAGYSVLPVASLDENARAFIIAQVQAQGGTVS